MVLSHDNVIPVYACVCVINAAAHCCQNQDVKELMRRQCATSTFTDPI